MVARARVRMIEEVMDTHFEPINWGLSELRWFKRAKRIQAPALESAAARQLSGFFAWLERQLGERARFNGEAFGWGDVTVIPFLNGSAGQGHRPPEGSGLAAWLARANARPSVVETLAEIVAIPRGVGMSDVAELVKKGLFKREYRDHRLEWMIKSGAFRWFWRGSIGAASAFPRISAERATTQDDVGARLLRARVGLGFRQQVIGEEAADEPR